MKAFEIQLAGTMNPTETLYATSEKSAIRWAEKNGYNIIKEIVKIIIK